MIPRQSPKQRQLALPFHPSVTAKLTDKERDRLQLALAQLLLLAAGVSLEGDRDEQ